MSLPCFWLFNESLLRAGLFAISIVGNDCKLIRLSPGRLCASIIKLNLSEASLRIRHYDVIQTMNYFIKERAIAERIEKSIPEPNLMSIDVTTPILNTV